MNIRDDIELTVLAETGDAAVAEACGVAVDTVWDMLCEVIGVDSELIKRPL